MDRETRRDQHAARDRQHHLDTAPTVLILRGCTVLALSPEFGAHSGALDGLQYTSVIHATRRARDRHAAIDEIERQVLRPNDRPDFALATHPLVSAVHSVGFADDAVRTLGNNLVGRRRFPRADVANCRDGACGGLTTSTVPSP